MATRDFMARGILYTACQEAIFAALPLRSKSTLPA